MLLLSRGTIGARAAWLNADEEMHRGMAHMIPLGGAAPTSEDKQAEVHLDK